MSRKDKCTQKHKFKVKSNLDSLKVDVFDDIFDKDIVFDKFPVLSVVTEQSGNLDKISIHELINTINKSSDYNTDSEDNDFYSCFADSKRKSVEKAVKTDEEDYIYFKSVNIDFPETVLTNILLSLWMEDIIKDI